MLGQQHQRAYLLCSENALTAQLCCLAGSHFCARLLRLCVLWPATAALLQVPLVEQVQGRVKAQAAEAAAVAVAAAARYSGESGVSDR